MIGQRVLVAIMAGGLLVVPVSGVSASTPELPNEIARSTETVVLKESSEAGTANSVCNFTQEGDYAHISSTPPQAVSAHGWWTNGDCPTTTAVVTTQVQKKNVLGIWVDVGDRGVKTVKSGGGSTNRSASRYTCSSTAKHTFRSWVDVDLVGVADAPNKLYTPARDLACN